MTINRKRFKTPDIAALVEAGDPFTFSRWGDGEWQSIFGSRKPGARNTDGSPYPPEMGKRLSDVLISKPPYILGIQSMALRILGKRIDQFATQHDLFGLDWRESDGLHEGMYPKRSPGEFSAFLAALRKRPIVFVGPHHLRRLTVLTPAAFVQVDNRYAFTGLSGTIKQAARHISSMRQTCSVLVCCGMSAEILIDELFRIHGDKHMIIDVGSVLDPFVGVQSRQYMKETRAYPMPK